MSSSRSQQDTPVGTVIPERGQVSPLTPDEQKLVRSRRKFLQITVGGSLAAIGAAFAFPVLAIKSITQYADIAAEGDLIGELGATSPLDLASIAVGTGLHGSIVGKSTQNNSNLLEIVRVADNGDANDWRVYNQICTHLGCPVSPELVAPGNIFCGCHGSNFSPEDGRVLAGPAARPLPNLPVTLNDQGQLAVAGEYSEPIGG